MVLSNENEEQVRHVVGQALQNSVLLNEAQEGLIAVRALAERTEERIREYSRERDRLNREIKALGFHDIGHARTEMQQLKAERDTARAMTPEEKLRQAEQARTSGRV